jgi:hypothetical protein
MKVRATVAVGLALAVGSSSACTWTSARVIPSGSVAKAPARAPDCEVSFFRTKVDRPYDELSAIQVEGGAGMLMVTPEALQREMAGKACGLGADAVFITQDYTLREGGTAWMTGVAIKYREAPVGPVDPSR